MRSIPGIPDTDQYWQSCGVPAFNKQRETAELQIRVLCTLHGGEGWTGKNTESTILMVKIWRKKKSFDFYYLSLTFVKFHHLFTHYLYPTKARNLCSKNWLCRLKWAQKRYFELFLFTETHFPFWVSSSPPSYKSEVKYSESAAHAGHVGGRVGSQLLWVFSF